MASSFETQSKSRVVLVCYYVVLVIFVLKSILSKNFLSKTEKATNRFVVARLFLLRTTVIMMKKMERDEEMKR